jgi:hypothetical protein
MPGGIEDNYKKTSVRIANLWAKIGTWDILNAKQVCYPLRCDIL